jgi:hypothetical protein
MSSDSKPTTFENRCDILADLWLNYRDDEEFKDFTEYNDLGLPLAYMLSNKIVEPTNMSKKFVDETFELLLAGLGIEDDEWEYLDEMLLNSNQDT